MCQVGYKQYCNALKEFSNGSKCQWQSMKVGALSVNSGPQGDS